MYNIRAYVKDLAIKMPMSTMASIPATSNITYCLLRVVTASYIVEGSLNEHAQ